MADGSLPAGAVQDATTITAPQNQNQRPGYYAALQVPRIPTPQTSTPLIPGQPPIPPYPPLPQPQHPQQPQPPQAQNANQPYYAVNYPPGAWQNAWQMAGYPYASGSAPYQQHHYSQIPYTQYQSQQYMTQFQHYPQPKKSSSTSKAVHKPRTPSPSPPPPELHRHWDGVIKAFLKKVGFHQALRGFEDDMFVLNADWERKKVPGAIGDLMRDLMTLGKSKDDEEDEPKEEPLEERKLEYVHLSTGEEPRSQTSINKSISTFLSQNRARNDASNRAEFLESLSQKRRRLNPDAEASSSSESIPSCARTDAKEINRDLQMKYDIAKNEEGPLRRTMKAASAPATTGRQQTQPITGTLSEEYLSERHPGLDERLKNIETHLAVRYVPSAPRTLLSRLNFLEDHLIHLEKEYPPWAALHFNQPNRGWPPPPRLTPIIVPSHITDRSSATTTSGGTAGQVGQSDSSTKGKNKSKSSLHRAVMERLEVQKAMSDLARKGEGS